jgi:putative SOS response-associated peptidase YedK
MLAAAASTRSRTVIILASAFSLKENYDLWLDPDFKDLKELARLLVPFDAAQMRCFPVSTRVNAVSNDDPGCVVPSATSTSAQRRLFG